MRPIIASQTPQVLRKRLEYEKDPIICRNLDLVATHLECEIRGDLAGTMAAVAPNPHYRFYDSGSASGTSTEVKGLDAVRAMYTALFAADMIKDQEVTEVILAADARGIAIEGLARMAIPGESLIAMGNKNARPGQKYLYEGHIACFIPISADGLILGEIVYVDPRGRDGIENRPLGAGDILELA